MTKKAKKTTEDRDVQTVIDEPKKKRKPKTQPSAEQRTNPNSTSPNDIRTQPKTKARDKSKPDAQPQTTPKPASVPSAPRKPVKGMMFKTHLRNMQYTDKRPGVVATIIECLLRAHQETEPVTKAEILEVCTKRFPERDPMKMKSTIANFPTWIPIERNVEVHKDSESGGFWIESAREPKPA